MAAGSPWPGWPAAVVGCTVGPAPDRDSDAMFAPQATFVDVQIALHASGCSEGGCHGAPNGQAGLELVGAPWENLVGAPATTCNPKLGKSRVVAGDPKASYLLNKLRGRGLCGGVRMPFGCEDTASSPCMKPERIALIESWIDAGASRE